MVGLAKACPNNCMLYTVILIELAYDKSYSCSSVYNFVDIDDTLIHTY